METKEGCEPDDIRSQYEALGVTRYYSEYGASYRNPHEPVVREIIGLALNHWHPDLSNVLDLACGSGEVTLALRDLATCPDNVRVSGIDPYTAEAYRARTGNTADPISFEQIGGGALAGRRYSLIICSFAMHLIDQSWLPVLLLQLGLISDTMWILTPHKRPEFRPEWGWILNDELIFNRVRVRQLIVES
ncbi:MAG: class I SAM-dependent methyltransferase [Acidobacteria bacterium]|nr:class I SAM-dependent methyltransferase [Acidobacteriota bacterium]